MHGAHTLPGQFLVSIVHWVEAAEQLEGKVRDVNDAEFVCLLLLDRAFQFPFYIDGSMKHCMRCPDQMFHRPTFGAILRPVQQALTILQSLFLLCDHQDSTDTQTNFGFVHALSWTADTDPRFTMV